MKKRIIIFGDSYCADKMSPNFAWSSLIAATNNYEIVNFAFNGSSTEYSLRNFINFIKDKSIRPDDIIIFQTSTIGRLDFMYQEKHPGTATQYQPWNAPFLPAGDHSWYHDNKEYIKWYVANRNLDSSVLQQTSYLHLIKSFAENNPTNTVILFKNTDHHDYTIPFNNFPTNMFVPNMDLRVLSQLEAGCDESTFTKHTLYDLRVNHLTLINRRKLVELIIEAIENRTIENFTYDSFAENIIQPLKSKKDYDYYVSLGIMEENDIADSCFTK